jgi:hypothetical protein
MLRARSARRSRACFRGLGCRSAFLRSAKPAELHVWAFDLLALNRRDLRKWSLEARQGRLQGLVSRFDCPVLLHSEGIQ